MTVPARRDGRPVLPEGAWSRLEMVVDEALDAPPAERARVVAEACGGDVALRDAALAWLRGCDDAAGLLDAPAPMHDLLEALEAVADGLGTEGGDQPQPRDTRDTRDTPAGSGERGDTPAGGARVGHWRLLEEIGRGGMGTVHLARRDDVELPMRAAVKLLHGGAAVHPTSARRFRDERRILAALDHPAIARLLDGGLSAAGELWFAMEYVAGAPIDDWCDRRQLPVEARLRLFAQVCDAVQHAHAHLVVHRDLKPANVLVSDAGEPKLLDFGIAKLLDAEPGSSDPALTHPGMQPMTRAYAAPEQLRGEPPSTATDVYALGVVLHVLLTGHLPHGARDLAGVELERRILVGGEARPSAAVRRTRQDGVGDEDAALPARVAAARGTTPARLQRRLRGDLDTIVARAMHPEPALRYATADALAADVRRHLDGLPVLARPTSLAYRMRKLVARHPLGTAATLVGTAAVIGFAVVTALQAAELRAQAVRLTAERDKAAEVTGFLGALLSSADPYQESGRVPTLREVLDRGAERAGTLAGRPELQAHLLSTMAPAYFGLGDWTRAGELAEQAVTLRRQALGGDHPALAASLLYLANVRLNERRSVEAEAHAREALAIQRRRARRGIVDADLDSVRMLNALGSALQGQGRLDDAEQVLRALLAIERTREPRDPRAVAQVARNLAHALRDARRHADAAPLYAEAYALHRTAHGDEHPETANSAVNLGLARVRIGDTLGGLALLRHGVDTKRRLLGIEHQDVAGDQLTLAEVLAARGAHAEARTLRVEAESALARVRRVAPPPSAPPAASSPTR